MTSEDRMKNDISLVFAQLAILFRFFFPILLLLMNESAIKYSHFVIDELNANRTQATTNSIEMRVAKGDETRRETEIIKKNVVWNSFNCFSLFCQQITSGGTCSCHRLQHLQSQKRTRNRKNSGESQTMENLRTNYFELPLIDSTVLEPTMPCHRRCFYFHRIYHESMITLPIRRVRAWAVIIIGEFFWRTSTPFI